MSVETELTPVPTAPSLPKSPGALLGAARLRAGMGLDDVAQRSRVPRSTLEAMERDDWSSLGAAVYVRGFVRLYAQEVGVPTEEAIGLLEELLKDQAPTVVAEALQNQVEVRRHQRGRQQGRVVRVLLLVLAALVALWAVSQI